MNELYHSLGIQTEKIRMLKAMRGENYSEFNLEKKI